jgi:hypothetical protein
MADRSPTRVGFIAGWGRSGSTLLERLFARHPEIVSVGEMRDIWERGCIENRLCGCGAPFHACEFWSAVGQEAFGGWGNIDAAHFASLRRHVDGLRYVPLLAGMRGGRAYEQRLGELTDAIARLYAAIIAVSGATIVIDSSKIPTYALLLRRAGMDLRVVHLVRDSRGVVFSWQKHKERTDASDGTDFMQRYTPSGASARYVAHNSVTGVLRSLGTPYLLVRYEDVVADAGPALQRAMAFVAPDLGSTAFESTEDGRVQLGISHSVDGNPMRLDREPVRLRLDTEWRTRMTARDIRTVTALTYPLLRTYGYVNPTTTATGVPQ